MTIREVLASVRQHAVVKTGRGASEEEISRVEKALDTTFPPEYREFLHAYGTLLIKGHQEWGPSEVRVFGPHDLTTARARFQARVLEWLGGREWLNKERPLPTPDPFSFMKSPGTTPPTLAQRRERLANELDVRSADLPAFFGDQLDELRFAYSRVVPVLTLNNVRRDADEEFDIAVCVGPEGRMFEVLERAGGCERKNESFLARLIEYIGLVFAAR